MKILVIGSGGREHALAWKLAQGETPHPLYFAPGNPGMDPLGQRLEIDPLDVEGLLLYAKREGIDLTVVGPEAPLACGIADAFQRQGLLIFGPTQAGARLEASKAYAKTLMTKAGVPTAGYAHCESREIALDALERFQPPYVIKEDGLAAGKGVTIAQTLPEAKQAIESAFNQNMSVVIEEFLAGEELSVLAICDGKRAIPLIGAQDFKKIGDGDTGPNTGGMGAYAPVPFVNSTLLQTIQKTVLDPMMAALRDEGIDYRGVLYAGLMIDSSGKTGAPEISVIEFNARFGDPETQVVLPLLDENLADVLWAAAAGDLSAYANGFRFKKQSAATVVLASNGYPGEFTKNHLITFPETLPAQLSQHALLFHAGTKRMPDRRIVTSSGRVLNCTGLGETLDEARANAYRLADIVTFDNKYHRTDIAQKAANLRPV